MLGFVIALLLLGVPCLLLGFRLLVRAEFDLDDPVTILGGMFFIIGIIAVLPLVIPGMF